MAATDIAAPLGQPDRHPTEDALLLLDWDTAADQLWRVPTGGAGRSLVLIPCVDQCRSHNEASWSHDGSRIVMFQAIGDLVDGIPTTCGLAIWSAASQRIEDVTTSPCAVLEERDPRFSPDDSSLAFWRSRTAGGRSTTIADSALFVRDPATGAERRLTDWSLHASSLDWAPDGAWLSFATDTWDESGQPAELWRVRPDGSGLERLYRADGPARLLRPRYSPDGRWILFVRKTDGRGELLAVPADGGDAVEVLPDRTVLDFDVRAATP